MKFNQIIALALAGNNAWRSGWQKKFHLEVDNSYSCPVLLRVADDGSLSVPWNPTEDDMFTDDWHIETGEEIVVAEGSWSLAFDNILNGKSVRLPEWHEAMKVDYMETPLPFQGKVLMLHLPNGTVVIYRPAPQDLAATDWEVCP